MKTAFIILVVTVGLSRAMAGQDLCQDAVEAYAKEKNIPFQFEGGSRKMKNAAIFDNQGNPKLYRNQKANANGRNNEGRVTLEVFEMGGFPTKYSLTYEDHCESVCAHSVTTFDLGSENGVCFVKQAQVKADLNDEKTLWNREICQGLKNSESARVFLEDNPDWQTKFHIRGDAKHKSKPLLPLIDANCSRFGKYSIPPVVAKPAAPAGDNRPASSTK